MIYMAIRFEDTTMIPNYEHKDWSREGIYELDTECLGKKKKCPQGEGIIDESNNNLDEVIQIE